MADVKKSQAQAHVDIKQSMREYLNTHERFATRMAASMRKGNQNEEVNAQKDLFVQGAQISLMP